MQKQAKSINTIKNTFLDQETNSSKNIQHAFRTGLKVNKSGEKHYRSKVNNKIVSIIRQSLKNHYTIIIT